nr:MAG TPA: hypothetical protein [Caudoviricetes sp.]
MVQTATSTIMNSDVKPFNSMLLTGRIKRVVFQTAKEFRQLSY